jgi:stage II sporulation protein D
VGRVFSFTGFGWGHGAGLCQWGAKRWAEKGWDFRQILRHYYPEASLSNSSVIASYPLFHLVTPSIQHGARSSVE